MATLDGIYYDEMPGSPTFGGGRDGPTAQRKLKVAWTDADAFLAKFFPATVRTGKGWIFPVSAAFPGKAWMSAQQFKLDAFDQDKTTGYNSHGVRAYDWAVLTVDYKAPEYDPENKGKDPAQQGDQILADHSLAFSAEMLKLGISGWKWSGSDDIGIKDLPIKNEDVSLAKLVPQIEHTLTWNYVPAPPFLTIAQHMGCINYDEKLFYASRGTLLFNGAEIKRSYHSQAGDEAWKVTYKFLQRCVWDYVNDQSGLQAVNWNCIYRPDTGNWDAPYRMTVSGTKAYIYHSVAFADLFKADGSEDTR